MGYPLSHLLLLDGFIDRIVILLSLAVTRWLAARCDGQPNNIICAIGEAAHARQLQARPRGINFCRVFLLILAHQKASFNSDKRSAIRIHRDGPGKPFTRRIHSSS